MNYCATIASLPATPFTPTPIPLLRIPQWEELPEVHLCIFVESVAFWGGVQRPLTLILLQKYRDTNGRRIVIKIGGVYTTFCQEEGMLLQKYRDRNRRCILILFKSIGVRGRLDSPEFYGVLANIGNSYSCRSAPHFKPSDTKCQSSGFFSDRIQGYFLVSRIALLRIPFRDA